MSSAWSITRAVNPPRALYLDYPLGHTTGRPDAPDEQLAIMRAALTAFESIQSPGEIQHLPYQWQTDHSWKDRVMRPRTGGTVRSDKHQDDRIGRHAEPQYQTEEDARLADENCPSCVFLNSSRSHP